MTITVYTQPGCGPCMLTCRELDRRGIEYTHIDLTTDPEAADTVKALGYKQAPVIVVDTNRHWSGFRPDKLASLHPNDHR